MGGLGLRPQCTYGDIATGVDETSDGRRSRSPQIPWGREAFYCTLEVCPHLARNFWMIAIAAALLLVAPIRKGDLAGYDDAVYAHIAKAIVKSGDWVNIQSNGFPALGAPSRLRVDAGCTLLAVRLLGLPCETALGVVRSRDGAARLLAGATHSGTIQGPPLTAMFVMLATPYFIKYTSHGMTDVPFTFLFTAAVCIWVLADGETGLVRGAVAFFAAYALLTRGIVGVRSYS